METEEVSGAGSAQLREYRLELSVVEGPDAGTVCKVNVPNMSVGTGAGCNLRLSDRAVSSVHCTIVAHEGQYTLRDADSRNGTFVNGLRVFEVELRSGSVIQVGRSRLRFRSSEQRDSLPPSARESFGELVGVSTPMRATFSLLERVAPTELTCLIQGETGTGKELCARAIHQHSARSDKPFVVIDCGAISEGLIEDKLFGHERGAFTGAAGAASGAFEEADGGTVFLDELGELPLRLQPKLLRVLERREVVRLGAHRARPLNIRLVAATHRDLKACVQEGTFRQDLFFRLSEAVVTLAPLRDRPDDIQRLARHILARDLEQPLVLNAEACAYLARQPWPGNVRELRNLLRRAGTLARDGVIDVTMLANLHEPMTLTGCESLRVSRAPDGQQPALVGSDLALAAATEAYREAYVRSIHARFLDDHQAAADHMGVNIKYARRLLRKYGLLAGPTMAPARRR